MTQVLPASSPGGSGRVHSSTMTVATCEQGMEGKPLEQGPTGALGAGANRSMQHHAGRGSGKRQRCRRRSSSRAGTAALVCSTSACRQAYQGHALACSIPAAVRVKNAHHQLVGNWVQERAKSARHLLLARTEGQQAVRAQVGPSQKGIPATQGADPAPAGTRLTAGRGGWRGGTPSGQHAAIGRLPHPLTTPHASSPWHGPGSHPSSLSRMHPQRALCMLRGPRPLASTRLQPAPAPPPPGRASAPWVA